ncbi:ChuX/HutX family heme-like substrate-binding protein [Bradyrhizobium sp. LHD-71]|uniref:ChuX/HutX family heme-like substrate-binding protein n=1 Tax=Bradyrhizobium sp. LHD-71 TaxID=3072141 RepID=UPI00280D29CE|nr:ChuX/HutX family heme-like substrate-binding protein [Bradyrhizobium sp. LHD-71]MDQ8729590.1 ChuX/HutX family heme-like substrate-binding protein [Bradyrhizobium sp. LHD-71]
MNDTISLRQQLTAAPDRVLARLPSMGKVMVVTQGGGVTHERIGVVERIKKDESRITFAGSAHDCTVDMAHVASAIADRSGRMKDKVLPKLEFADTDGRLMFSVVGLDGLEKFDDALARFVGVAVAPTVKEQGPSVTLDGRDPGLAPLVAAHKAGEEIAIELQKPGVVQRWRGFVPPVNPAMGFINVITSDFHLHLRGGTVARWECQETNVIGHVRLRAFDADGNPVGLTLQGPQNAFEAS